MKYRFFLLGILLLAIMMLIGCEGTENKSGPESTVANNAVLVSVTKQAPEAAPESERLPAPFVYSPTGKRDPFEALLTVQKPVTDGQPLTPLQKFDLGQFRIAGIITGKAEPMALVTAGGKSYILKKGVKIGKNAGIVVGVEQDGILVEEKFYDFSGAYRKSIQKVQLPQREGVY